MKAPDVHYECPETMAEALALIADDDQLCQPLAGGQSLLPMMNLRMAQPDVLVDLNRLSELDFIVQSEGQIHIGAMVRYRTLMQSPLVREHLPLLSMALPHIAHHAIRNRGTIGGSIALADPAAEMPALLKALNGTVVVVSKSGQREIPADAFFLGVYETALDQGELVHSLKFPAVSNDQRFGFYELARRHGDYAMAGVAISAAAVNPCSELRIVFFGVADLPLRLAGVEAALEGRAITDEEAIHKSQQLLTADQMLSDAVISAETRLQLARVALKRALVSMAD
jgi:carbon-monoxide dehydrogenase medium subunit